MNPEVPEEQESREEGSGDHGDLVWVTMVWGRVVLGLVLAATGGVAFGHAWTRDYAPFWWVGGITLLTGILLVLSGLYARSGGAPLEVSEVVPERQSASGETLVPLLGALLVYKYQRISHRQLEEALSIQRKEKRMLGEIMVGMGIITRSQLDEALEYQREHMRRRQASEER